MQIILFSSDMQTIDEWVQKESSSAFVCYEKEELEKELLQNSQSIIIADYDTKANEINSWISSNTLPLNVIVLERVPEVVTGKMLIYRGIKAYGNSRMLKVHYEQMIQAVSNEQIWTYPELTAKLAKKEQKELLNQDSLSLINNKLSLKETEVVYSILEGLTNDAIANKMGITTRTVKAHISSIFNKLHVSDRLSLALLLK